MPADFESSSEETLRLFLAVLIPRELQQKIYAMQQHLQGETWQVDWSSAQNLHLTLHFLGKTPHRILDDLQRELSACVHRLRPFEISAGGLGVFPHIDEPRILWAGLDDRHGHLKDLFDKSRRILSRYRLFNLNENFTPHITVGRVRDLRGWQGQRLASLRSDWNRLGRLAVEEVVMIKSEQGSPRTVYQRVFGARLGGET